MKTSVIGYPRIGKLRELKFAEEKYFRGELTERELRDTAEALRVEHWRTQDAADIDLIPSNDFSFYDTTLDAAELLNIVPATASWASPRSTPTLRWRAATRARPATSRHSP